MHQKRKVQSSKCIQMLFSHYYCCNFILSAHHVADHRSGHAVHVPNASWEFQSCRHIINFLSFDNPSQISGSAECHPRPANFLISWHHLVIWCCPRLLLPFYSTHFIILMDHLLSALLIKWLTQLQFLPLISTRISTTGTYSLWLYVWLNTDWNYNLSGTEVMHVEQKVCLVPWSLSKGTTLTRCTMLGSISFTSITCQRRCCSGSAPAWDSINCQRDMWFIGAFGDENTECPVGEHRCRYTWVCTWKILGLDNSLPRLSTCSVLSWAPRHAQPTQAQRALMKKGRDGTDSHHHLS